jgi:hypothetical protein
MPDRRRQIVVLRDLVETKRPVQRPTGELARIEQAGVGSRGRARSRSWRRGRRLASSSRAGRRGVRFPGGTSPGEWAATGPLASTAWPGLTAPGAGARTEQLLVRAVGGASDADGGVTGVALGSASAAAPRSRSTRTASSSPGGGFSPTSDAPVRVGPGRARRARHPGCRRSCAAPHSRARATEGEGDQTVQSENAGDLAVLTA